MSKLALLAKSFAGFFAAAVLLVACLWGVAQFDGPLGPIPGTTLSGEPAENWPDWKKLIQDDEFIQVQFRPGDPYSVTLAPHVVDDQLYTWSYSENNWVDYIRDDPDVIIRADGRLYEARAIAVTEPNTLARVNQDRGGISEPEGISFHLTRR